MFKIVCAWVILEDKYKSKRYGALRTMWVNLHRLQFPADWSFRKKNSPSSFPVPQ